MLTGQVQKLAKCFRERKPQLFKKCLIFLLVWITVVFLGYVYVTSSTGVHLFHRKGFKPGINTTHIGDLSQNTTYIPQLGVYTGEVQTNLSPASYDKNITRTTRYSSSYLRKTINESQLVLQNNSIELKQANASSVTSCDFPEVDPFDKALQNITKKYPPIDCSKQTPHLVYVQGDTIYINHTKIRSLIFIRYSFRRCRYEVRVRAMDKIDSKTKRTYTSPFFTHSIKVTHDYVVVVCYGKNSRVISRSFLTFIRKKPKLESELKAKYEAHVQLHSPKETLSVMMVGIDAMSKNNFQRAMPKTRNFLLETMKAVELYKHNKFGHNTFPNVVGLLTGNNEESLVKLNYSWNMPIDNVNHAFLWSAYRNAGYRTGMFLDMTEITAFHYQKKGWTKPPVDYYFREVVIDSEKDKLMRENDDCIGDVPDIRLLTDYWVQLAALFNNSKTEPYFTYSFSARLTHDDENRASAADELYFKFLQTLVDKKVLNNTVLVFFSDHGPRFGPIRSIYNGMLEGRMPYMFLVFPPWFHTKYPQLMEVVKTNQHRLTTHTDVYETLIDLLYFKAETGKGSLTQPRISLFKEIPEGRTCQHARIPVEYCVCNGFSKAEITSMLTEFLGRKLVVRVNDYITGKLRTRCSTLYLKQVTNLIEIKPDSSGSKRYQVTVMTEPNSAIYEGIVTINDHNEVVDTSDVTRLNLYRGQAECINDPKLRQFCYCKRKRG